MSNDQIFYILIGLLGVVFSLLTAVIGWVGIRLHSKQDNLYELIDVKFTTTADKLVEIEQSLVDRIFSLDRRVTIVESETEHRKERKTA